MKLANGNFVNESRTAARGVAAGRRLPRRSTSDRLAELDESGLTMREIAAEMGVSPAFVCRALKARQRLPAPAFGD